MKKLFILTFFAVAGIIQAQTTTTNILLKHDNKPIDFTKINAVTVQEAVALVLKQMELWTLQLELDIEKKF